MQRPSFFLFLMLFSTVVLKASSLEGVVFLNEKSQYENLICEVPAPKNFHVIGVGTTDVHLGWDYVDEAVGGYRIRTYRASDNLLVNTTIKAQDQIDAVISNLTPGTEYYAIINGRCDGGGESSKEANGDFGTLISDLVVIGYQGSNNTEGCTIPVTGGSCTFPAIPNTESQFKIFRGSNTERFSIKYIPAIGSDDPHFEVRIPDATIRNPQYAFYCIDEWWNGSPGLPAGCSGAHFVEVKFANNTYIRFAIEDGATTVATLTASFFNTSPNCSGCKIVYMGYNYNGLQAPDPSYTGLRSGLPNTPDFAAVAPNPFNDRLQVYVDDLSAESVHCQLFNVNGQKVLDQQFQGAQDTYELITENLANGFYLLRVEANGMVQTLRVIKAE
ncbi:MAG TPA: T9SS type A sorting domain-containing protein [Saprospiraceae bacterium]|nr:T9SS type A sorting domain-containing protein [Saprospiraceae bacterium]